MQLFNKTFVVAKSAATLDMGFKARDVYLTNQSATPTVWARFGSAAAGTVASTTDGSHNLAVKPGKTLSPSFLLQQGSQFVSTISTSSATLHLWSVGFD